MNTRVHIVNVGQGNMVLIETASGEVLLCDCNVTVENESRVLAYVKGVMAGRCVYAFINTHRDADHMRGINRVHRVLGVARVWDSGLSGGDIFSPEYTEYMRMRREVPHSVLGARTYYDFGVTRIRILNAACDDLPDDCNAQSLVLKVQHGRSQNSIILTGDSDVATWRKIRERYTDADLSSEILLGSHHGAFSFFDGSRPDWYHSAHIKAINPAMTLLSVGRNPYGHPDPKALRYYELHSRGSVDGHRVWRTDSDGTMRLDLSDATWSLYRGVTVPVPLPRPSASALRPAPVGTPR